MHLPYTLAILYYENFKNAYRSEQGYIKKDVLIKDILLSHKLSRKNHFRTVIEKILCQRQLYLP